MILVSTCSNGLKPAISGKIFIFSKEGKDDGEDVLLSSIREWWRSISISDQELDHQISNLVWLQGTTVFPLVTCTFI